MQNVTNVTFSFETCGEDMASYVPPV